MTRTVGYGNPPKHSRFQKGKSGNPSGRPKRKPSFNDDLLAELGEVITITEGGATKRITKQRALIKALTAAGIKGNNRAIGQVASLMARASQGLPVDAGTVSAADRKILEDYLERQVQERLALQTRDE